MPEITIRPFTTPTAEMILLCARTLGPGRFARTAYRVREAADQAEVFGFNAYDQQELIGTISLTPVKVGLKHGACLVGPLVIASAYQNKGHGRALIEKGIEEAANKGLQLALLVGDLDFYSKSGFVQVPERQINLPGPVNPARLLAREITKGVLPDFSGELEAITAKMK